GDLDARLAERELQALGHHDLADAQAVGVEPVERVEVTDRVALGDQLDLHVLPRDRGIAKLEVAVLVGAHHHAIAIELHALLLVGPADDFEAEPAATQRDHAVPGGDLHGVHASAYATPGRWRVLAHLA